MVLTKSSVNLVNNRKVVKLSNNLPPFLKMTTTNEDEIITCLNRKEHYGKKKIDKGSKECF